MSLSPWDLSGTVGFDVRQYRPRRPSYVFATQEPTQQQQQQQRRGSYQNATDPLDDDEPGGIGVHHPPPRRSPRPYEDDDDDSEDFISGVVRMKRLGNSYHHSVAVEEVKLHSANAGGCAATLCDDSSTSNHIGTAFHERSLSSAAADRICGYAATNRVKDPTTLGASRRDSGSSDSSTAGADGCTVPRLTMPNVASDTGSRGTEHCGHKTRANLAYSKWRYIKNLVVLSLSFILVFSAFRSIQNLQSSLNAGSRLGVVAMSVVHFTMFLTCLLAPMLVNKLSSKWTIVLGLIFYLFWIAANFFPHPYTLLPTSVGVGLGQSLAWGAQVRYIQQLALDSAHVSKELTHQELYKFNGIFLACFQTSHVWGNLVSSLILGSNKVEPTSPRSDGGDAADGGGGANCGVYDSCYAESMTSLWTANSTVIPASNAVLKLMGSYLVFAFTGFVLIVFFLEKIGPTSDQKKPCREAVPCNVRHLLRHDTYRLLIPLLIFNGFEQGFVYSDYTKSYITCTIGMEYVGYNMITLGMTNSVFSILIGLATRHMAREAIVGIAAILHLGLMVFLLVWIPARNLMAIFFVLSALWGVCDAIWQTQCNCLVNLCCVDEHDVAFQNFRMLQGFGAAVAFFLSTFLCVSVKLYILIGLLILSIICYVFAEYKLRRTETRDLSGNVDNGGNRSTGAARHDNNG